MYAPPSGYWHPSMPTSHPVNYHLHLYLAGSIRLTKESRCSLARGSIHPLPQMTKTPVGCPLPQAQAGHHPQSAGVRHPGLGLPAPLVSEDAAHGRIPLPGL